MIEVNKIYNEDCINTMARMKDNFIDLVVTSPPYDDMRTYKNNVGLKWSDKIWKPIIKELFRIINIGGVVVWIVGDKTENGSETGTSFKQALYFKECGFNLHDTMIYCRQGRFPEHNRYWQDFEYMFIFSKGKPIKHNIIKDQTPIKKPTKIIYRERQKNGTFKTPRTNRSTKHKKARSNIWYIPAGNGVSSKDSIIFKHPATFPEKLAADHIKSWSNENDLIYDCFAGSGTTFKMSHLLKRRFIGSEISAEYCELANKRVKPYLDQKTLF